MFQVFGVLQKRQLCTTAALQISKQSYLLHQRAIQSLTPTDFEIVCYVTVGTFARHGLSSTAKTLRSLSGVRGSEY